MSGDYSQKRNLPAWAASPSHVLAGFLVPVLTGFTAMALHGTFRYPMNIPGHHGLEFMALLTGLMIYTRRRQSAYLFSIGTAIAMPVFGIMNPLNMLSYLLPGIVMGQFRQSPGKVWLYAVAGGLAYASIPVLRLSANLLFHIPVASFIKFGYAIPVLNFFLFGLLGSLAGIAVIGSGRRLSKKTR